MKIVKALAAEGRAEAERWWSLAAVAALQSGYLASVAAAHPTVAPPPGRG